MAIVAVSLCAFTVSVSFMQTVELESQSVAIMTTNDLEDLRFVAHLRLLPFIASSCILLAFVTLLLITHNPNHVKRTV